MFGNELPPGPVPPGVTTPPPGGGAKFDVATELMITVALKVAEQEAGGMESLAEEGKFPKRAAYAFSQMIASSTFKAALGENTPEYKEAMRRFMMAGSVPPVKDSGQAAADGQVTRG